MSPSGAWRIGAAATVALLLAAGHVMREEDPVPASTPDVSAAPPPAASAPSVAPPPEDPEALEVWFEDQMRRELTRAEAQAARERLRRRGPSHATVAALPLRERARAWGIPEERLAQVDWEYVEGVFAGTITGIPSEQKAGLSLRELDELGDVPALEELRKEAEETGDWEPLEDLGFESIPWPACLRTGTCRRDLASSP